jgi:large subunit ribosomal protein L18
MKKGLQKFICNKKNDILKKIVGTSEKPRLAVFRSHKHIYAQLIDDTNGHTLAFQFYFKSASQVKLTAACKSIIVGQSL